jgi:hypothetical protein
MLPQSVIDSVVKLVWKRVLLTIFGGFSILTVVGVVLYLYSMYTAYEKGVMKAEDKIESQIIEQFSEPHISDLIKKVASGEAESLLEEDVTPVIENFKTELNDGLNDVETFISELKTKYEDDFKSLSKEVKILAERNRIAELGDKGVLNGDREAFDELIQISSTHPNESIKSAALSEARRIKGFWAGVSSLKGTDLISMREGEENFKAVDFDTNRLIAIMLTHKRYGARALAAQELGKRKDALVPASLVQTIKTDKNLEVVKNASNSFEKLTDYKCPDVFGFDQIPSWWEQNKEKVLESFKLKE